MNLSKKQWTIVGVVIALVAIWYFFLRKKKAESNYGPMGGMYSHFGNETGFATPGSGYGLNNLESGYKMAGVNRKFSAAGGGISANIGCPTDQYICGTTGSISNPKIQCCYLKNDAKGAVLGSM